MKEVSQLTSDDIANIVPDNHDEALESYAAKTLSSVDKIEAATKEINAKLGMATFDNFVEMANTNVQNMLEAYTRNLGTIAETVKQQRLDASNEQKELLTKLNTIFGDYTGAMKTAADYKVKSEETFKKLRAKVAADDAETAANREQTSTEQAAYQEAYENAGNRITKAWYKGRLAEGEALMENGGERDSWSGKGMSAGWTGIKTFFSSLVDDGVVEGGGHPMSVAASKVTPIHDGSVSLAKSDPADSAIFAKTGGPFDKLFDGVFGKINEVYSFITNVGGSKSWESRDSHSAETYFNAISNAITSFMEGSSYNNNTNVGGSKSWQKNDYTEYNSRRSTLTKSDSILSLLYGSVSDPVALSDRLAQYRSNGKSSDGYPEYPDRVLPRAMQYEMPEASIADMYRLGEISHPSSTPSGMTNKMGPIDVNVHGDISLNANGQQIDISKIVEEDPAFVRRITQLILSQISNTVNGGKNLSWTAMTRPFINY